MTKEEFLEQFKTLKTKGFTIKKDEILTVDPIRIYCDGVVEGYFCPITAVHYNKTHHYKSLGDWREASVEMGLDLKLAREILDAADFWTRSLNPKPTMREALELAWQEE